MRDASCFGSFARLNKPTAYSPFHSNKIDQLSYVCRVRRVFPLMFLASALLGFSSAQTPDPKALDAAYDFKVSIARLKTSSTAWSHLQAAHRKLANGNLVEAAAEADQVLHNDPRCAPALSMKAFIELAAKNSTAAVQDAAKATLIDPYDAVSFIALAMAYNASGAFSESQRAARDALRVQPDAWDARLELAKGLYSQGQWDAALRELNAIRKDFPDVHLVKGNVLMSLGNRQEGAAEFTKFVEEAPLDRRVDRIKQIIAESKHPNSQF